MPTDAGKYDFVVDPSNRNSTYGLICDRVPSEAAVLDIGCSSGNLGLVLERLRGCRVLGIDIDRDAAAVARSKGIEAIVADLTHQPLADVVGERRFDVIILADVLEHLVSPAGILAPVGSLLKPGGRVLCSFPNITHLDVQVMLAQDEWRTQPTGILDETHLRFFTVASFTELAFACGYDVAAIDRVTLPPLGTEVLDYGQRLSLGEAEVAALAAVSHQGNPNSEVYQYVFELHRAPERRRLSEGLNLARALPGDPAQAERPGRLDVVVRTVEGRLQYLRDALYSLAGVTYPAVRAIVCVDSSSPAYADEVRELGDHLSGLLELTVTVVPSHQAQRGRPLNWGLDQASGEYLAFLDDDDVYYPAFGDRLIGCLKDHPQATVAYGIGQVVRGEATDSGFRALSHLKQYDEPFDRARLFLENYIPINTLVVRRAAIMEAGIRFDESLPIYEDWAFLRELAARFEFKFVNAVVSEYRLRTDGSNAVPEGSEGRWERTAAQVQHRYAAQTVRLRAEELATLAQRARAPDIRTQAELDALRAELAGAKSLNRQLLSSRSWKLTRPLRRLLRSGLPEEA